MINKDNDADFNYKIKYLFQSIVRSNYHGDNDEF